jgi:hypothetical protein
LVAVYAVVAAVNEAALVYNASLKAFPVEAVKLCTPFRSSVLKDVHIKFPVKAMLESPYEVSQFRMPGLH